MHVFFFWPIVQNPNLINNDININILSPDKKCISYRNADLDKSPEISDGFFFLHSVFIILACDKVIHVNQQQQQNKRALCK